MSVIPVFGGDTDSAIGLDGAHIERDRIGSGVDAEPTYQPQGPSDQKVEEARRDQAVRAKQLAQLEQTIAGSDSLTAAARQKLHAKLRAKPELNRYLRITKTGRLRINKTAISAEQHLDGKFLLRSSDPTLSAEDIALGYKQLLQIERAWRDMKTTLDLRPVHHRKERPHPRARDPLLVGAAADPNRREPSQRQLAQPP
jgi:hypothetical protein